MHAHDKMMRNTMQTGWHHPMLACFILLTLSSLVAGWDPTTGVLNVHVVPHSHNDPGWWMTFEGYYQEWTKGIISSVVQVLAEEQSRTFIWAEISYFQRWWIDQQDSVKETVKRLVQNGQLEFVTAGWVMNDEANTHMVDIINQLTEGHEWLSKTLDTKPRFGWAIDPFGHSPTMPNVLQHMDFEGIVVNRAHKDLKEEFRNTKRLEFMWQGDLKNGSASFNMLTHMLPWRLYDIPNTCGPDWNTCASFDFERNEIAVPITPSNVAERSKILINMYKEKAKLFRHNSVLIPLGDDFKYKNPDITRKMMTQYEMLFEYINSNKDMGVNIQFSTLGKYFGDIAKYKKEEEAKSNQPWLPTYQGDFFTYCDEGQDYWSGYFTTRPYMKGLTRSTQAILRTGEILATLSTLAKSRPGVDRQLAPAAFERLQEGRRNVALFQHHDGVTGTARRQVVNDYATRLLDSLAKVAELASDMALVVLSDSQTPEEKLTWTVDPATSHKRVLDVKKTEGVIVVFNSLGHARAEIVTVTVNSHNVAVVDGKGDKVAVQIDPIWEGESKQASSEKFSLHFLAEVQGIGLNTYFIKPVSRQASLASVVEYTPEQGNGEIAEGWNFESKALSEETELQIANTEYRVHFTGYGAIKKIIKLAGTADAEQLTTKVEQTFLSYSSSGGAYLFLPRGEAQNMRYGTSSVRVVTGPLVSTVTAVTDSSIKERIVRVFECYAADSNTPSRNVLACPQKSGVEVLHIVDLKESNTEVITRLSTDLSTQGRFYTDSNGFDMRERHYDSKLPIQGNYYPITSAVYIESQSTKVRLTALSHQAHGATSLKDGVLEIMLDRRLDRDDGRGLGEPVTDNVRTTIPLWLVLEAIPAAAFDPFAHPALSQKASEVWHTRNYPLHSMHTPVQPPTASFQIQEHWAQHHQLAVGPLGDMPKQLRLLTLAPRGESNSGEAILRMYRPPVLEVEKSYLVNAENLFREHSIESWKETSLSMLYEKHDSNAMSIQLQPTEIITSVITFGDKKPASVHQNGNEKSDDKEKVIEEEEGHNNAEEEEDVVVISEEPQKYEDEEDEAELIVPPIPKQDPVRTDKDKKDDQDVERPHGQQPPRPGKFGGEGREGREGTEGNKGKAGREGKDGRREPGKGDGGKGRAGRVGEGKDGANFKLKEKAPRTTNTSGLYAMSIVFYLALLVVVLVGGWLLGKRRRNNSTKDKDARVPTIWKEREDSMMKLL